LRHVLLGAILLALHPLPGSGQLPPRLQNCSGHPIYPYVPAPTRDDKPDPKVSIEDVAFQGEMDLPESIKEQLVGAVEQTSFESASDWINALEEIVRNELEQHGYFYAQVTAEPRVISTEPETIRVSVTFQINEGEQYRLSEIRFKNANVFPAEQLRSQFALQDGDIFNLQKIRQGLEALVRLYGRYGYINLTASPDLYSDRSHRLISMIVELDSGIQFRVGSVEIFGLDPKIVNNVLKTKLRQGDVFDSKLVHDFFIDNKSVLPVDASEVDDLWIKQNPAKSTVAIVLDFRTCPRDSM